MDRRDKVKTSILLGINHFASKNFKVNPYNYLYESDIKSHLMCILRDCVKDKITIKNISNKYNITEPYELGMIYTEYKGPNLGSNERIDLVCLDLENTYDLNSYSEIFKHKNNDLDPLWDQPLLVGIEIKYITQGYSSSKGISESETDKVKLEKYKIRHPKYAPQFEHLSLCFVQEDWSNEIKRLGDEGLLEDVEKIESYNEIYIIGKDNTHKLLK